MKRIFFLQNLIQMGENLYTMFSDESAELTVSYFKKIYVRRGSVGSASACWKAGPSSILGMSQGCLSH
jgi:hypothetical protein